MMGAQIALGKSVMNMPLRILVVEGVHKRNGGLTSARKCGVGYAKGRYSIQIDPDDWVESSLLEDLYQKAIKVDADIVIL